MATTTSTSFVGTNNRSLAQFLNEKNSDCDFIHNPKNGHIFMILTATGEQVSMSENAQEAINKDDASMADFQVVDMPAKDKETGMPNGKVFALVTCKSSQNVVKSFRR